MTKEEAKNPDILGLCVIECQNCDEANVTKWCVECEKVLCDDCSHRIHHHKSTKHHKLLHNTQKYLKTEQLIHAHDNE